MFHSILFPDRPYDLGEHRQAQPEYFRDLCLDQIMAASMKGQEGPELSPLFYTPLRDPDAIRYRQEVLRDLDDPDSFRRVKEFAAAIHGIIRRTQAAKNDLLSLDGYRNHYLTKGRMLDDADRYRQAIGGFVGGMNRSSLRSRGLNAFMEYLEGYVAAEPFTTLCKEIQALRGALAEVRYCMLIKNGTISVRRYEDQEDESAQILALFEKFKQDQGTDYRRSLPEIPVAEHVEAAVLEMLAGKCYPEAFARLDRFCAERMDFMDDTIADFARQAQFYLCWQEYCAPFRAEGFSFCYPQIRASKGDISCEDAFDLALAKRLWPEGKPVTNGFRLQGSERVLVITGPNQGGKTTFARMFGQLHHLCSLGLSVPGSSAALYAFDTILTHFERGEDLTTLNGKLQDDLVRLREMFRRATGDSILILNEIFSSTTLQDALLLGRRMMERIAGLDAYAVCVTFLDELASCNEKTVSMMSTVFPENPARRTFKVLRQPANGLAYALHLAEKYNLTYERLSKRLAP